MSRTVVRSKGQITIPAAIRRAAFLADGDPLETETHVLSAFIQGRRVDLTNRHEQLWRKYQEKYRRLDAAASPEDSP